MDLQSLILLHKHTGMYNMAYTRFSYMYVDSGGELCRLYTCTCKAGDSLVYIRLDEGLMTSYA